MSERPTSVLALLVVALAMPAAIAASVPDPTRPAIAAPPAAGADAEAPAPAPLVLQSTLVSPTQQVAVINGRRFAPGDRIGDARLEAIGPGWVRLATPTGRTELRLSFSNPTPPVNR